MLPWEKLNFLNVRNAVFWHSARLFITLLQMPALQNLKGFFGDPPLNPMFFRPSKAIFFHAPSPLKSHQPSPPPPYYLIINERSLSISLLFSFILPFVIP